MNIQKDSTSSFLNMLSGIKEQLFQQKRQAIVYTEQMIQSKDSSYISQILTCFPIGCYQLSQLDADMRKLSIICEIVAAEEKLPAARMFFLERVETFDGLIQKYIWITFLLRRLEFHLPEEALRETAAVLIDERISICALRKITDCELFADGDNVYSQALNMIGGTLK